MHADNIYLMQSIKCWGKEDRDNIHRSNTISV